MMDFFIHIPKTAGTSIITIIQRQILFDECHRIHSRRDEHPQIFLQTIEQKCHELIHGYQMLAGHFGFGIHHFFEGEHRYFTMLRNPAERVFAEYQYMQQGYFHGDLIKSSGLSIEDYLNHPETAYLENLQTRVIAGASFEVYPVVNEEVFKTAESNLSSFVSVGVQDMFVESLACFTIDLGWSRVPQVLWRNQGKNDAVPNSKSVRKIETRDKYDLMLYQMVKTEVLQRSKNDHQVMEMMKRIKNSILDKRLDSRIRRFWNRWFPGQ